MMSTKISLVNSVDSSEVSRKSSEHCICVAGLGECHDMSKAFVPGGCPANTYIVGQVATLQASIDAAITKVQNYWHLI